jgi:GNAT superfamily N-acetyltransferase
MFGRCSEQTRYQRFHGVVNEMPAAYLRRCLGREPPGQRAFVGELVTGAGPGAVPCLVGLASAGPVPGASNVREVGVLVEDDRQRQGIGRLLFAVLLADAHVAGVGLIRLELCRARPSLLAYVLANMDIRATRDSGCDVTVDAAVPAPAAKTSW